MNMKNLIISALCACMALAVAAGASESDVAQSQRVLNNRSSAVTAPVSNGKTGKVSLQQLVRERNAAKEDSHVIKKTPSGVTLEEMDGIRISVTEASAIEFDSDGNFWVNDTIYSLGEKSEIIPEDGITNVYLGYGIPFEYNDNGDPCLRSYYDVRESIGVGRNRTDTITRVYFFTSNYFFNDVLDTVPGQTCDDGSIVFGDDEMGVGVFYFEEVYYHYRYNQLYSVDSICTISPFFRKISLLIPNGVHHFKGRLLISPVELYIDSSLYDSSYYVSLHDSSGGGSSSDPSSGFVGPAPSVVCGGGGLAPRPIGGYPHRSPAKPTPTPKSMPDGLGCGGNGGTVVRGGSHPTMIPLGTPSPFTVVERFRNGFPVDTIDGHGGINPRPPQRPLTWPGNLYVLSNGSGPGTSFMSGNPSLLSNDEPIYMYQADDSTLLVYNLFGFGSTVNCMKIHEDGSLVFPGQALYYNDNEGDIFNFSLQNDLLVSGNTGYISSDTIFWDDTYINSEPYWGSTANMLIRTDGSQFLVGFAEEPTIEVAEGDDAYTFTAVTTEEGAELCLYIVDDEGMIIDSVENPYVVERTDQDQVINLGVIATVPGKNDNYYLAQYLIPAKEYNYQEGDLNHDGKVSIVDVATLVNFLLNGHWDYSRGK